MVTYFVAPSASERPAGAGCRRFGAARYGRCLRVFDLHPLIGSAGAIRRAEALRHDALAAERAGVLEDDRPVASVVLVEGDAFMGVSGARRRRRRRHPVRCRQDAVYFHLIS
jgi:hypothetical protein